MLPIMPPITRARRPARAKRTAPWLRAPVDTSRTIANGACPAMVAAVVLAAWPDRALAHAFGARYDLPLPLALYLGAAGVAVAASFLIPALLLRAGGRYVPAAVPAPAVAAGVVQRALRALAVALLALVLACAVLGPESPTGNLAAVFVWVLWWVGLGLVQALVVDLWSALDPWRSLSRQLERLRRGSRPRRYPIGLGYWPAAAGFAVFAWLELISSLGEQPRVLGLLALGYGVATLAGAWRYGRAEWFGRADPFAVVFATLGRMAPLQLAGGRLRLRLPGAGLLVDSPVPASLGALVLTLLATVSFDGFKETSAWAAVLDRITASELLHAPLLALQARGVDLLALVETLGLAAAVVSFACAYLAAAVLIDRASGAPAGTARCAGSFVLTLVPIAVAYHLAHYLSYLLIAGQLAIPLASDPFALGWDLLGTADYAIDIAIVDARFVWWTAVASIVAGHALAVFLAHAMALRLYRDARAALRSQVPMLVLMVGYTMASLWILSQPIVTA